MKSETLLIIGAAVAAYLFISSRGDKGGSTGGSLELPQPLTGAFQTGGDPYNPATAKTNDTPVASSFDISPKIQTAMANPLADNITNASIIGSKKQTAESSHGTVFSSAFIESGGLSAKFAKEAAHGTIFASQKQIYKKGSDEAVSAWGRGDISQMITYSMPDIWHPGQMFTGQTTGGVGVAISNLKEAAARRGMEFDAKKITVQNRNVKYG